MDAAIGATTTPWRPTIRSPIRRGLPAFQAALTLLFVLLFLWRVDIGEVAGRFGQFDARWIMFGLGVSSFSKFVQSYRWRLLLGRWQQLSLRRIAGVYLVGTLAGTLLPLRAGDVLRVQVAAHRLGVPRAELAATVFIVETLMDWLASLVLLSVGLAMFLDLPPAMRPLFAGFVAIAIAGLAGAVALARLDQSYDFGSLPVVRRLPVRARRAVVVGAARFLEGLAGLRDPVRTARIAGVSIIIWLLEVTVYWSLGQAFGLDLPFVQYFLVMVGGNLILAFPFTPWSLGSFEVAVSEVIGLLGIERATAGSYALGVHLLIMSTISILGLAATWALGLGPRDLFGAPVVQIQAGDRDRAVSATPAATHDGQAHPSPSDAGRDSPGIG